jgi:hypothetical protein
MKLSDAADGDSLMRQVAQAQLGPLLASVGSDEDPYSFFLGGPARARAGSRTGALVM